MADVYMFPTKEEGLGTPMLEAIACGTPVVANNIQWNNRYIDKKWKKRLHFRTES
jgi:glycosyltransferase involved in cell wall biosynthesis